MLWGFPWGCRWGQHEHMLLNLELAVIGNAIRIRFTPATGYSQYYRIVVDGIPQALIYGTAGDPCEVWGVPDYAQTLHHVSVCPQGEWSTTDIDVLGQQDSWEEGRSNRLKVRITPALDIFSTGDSSQLTSWSLTGLNRFQNTKPVARRPQWARLDVTLATSGGTRTLTLALDGYTIATGTRTVAAGNGTITLSASNSSGVSGSVALTYSADISSGGRVYARYPASYPIHYRTSSFSGGDFPRTAELTITDDFHSNTFIGRSGALVAGTYYVVGHQKDDDGNESTNTDGGGQTVAIVAVPAAPTNLAYASGDYSNTVISWTASTTAGATYNYFDSGDTGFLDVITAAGTHVAGTGTLTQALAAIDSGFTGIRYVLVRAVSGGVEEQNVSILKIEYASGVVVPSRPNAPSIAESVTTSGRTLTVPVSINTAEQAIAASTVKLFLFAVGGSPNYASPDGSVAVPSGVGSTINVSVSATAGSDVVRMFAVRTQSAAGTQSDNTDTYGPVKLTTATPSAPTTVVEVGY